LSGSDILSDALDFVGVPVDTPSEPQQTTPMALAMTGVGRDITADEVQNVEVDAKEMEAFLTSLEALLTLSSESLTCSSMETAANTTISTTTNDSVGLVRDGLTSLHRRIIMQCLT
jgi:hypothetical protein